MRTPHTGDSDDFTYGAVRYIYCALAQKKMVVSFSLSKKCVPIRPCYTFHSQQSLVMGTMASVRLRMDFLRFKCGDLVY